VTTEPQPHVDNPKAEPQPKPRAKARRRPVDKPRAERTIDGVRYVLANGGWRRG
jgi:hypothetical protein